MFAYGIFKVIYSPFKAFKEIIQKPRYIGPVLTMILFVAANVGFVYAAVSKIYVEQTLPKASQLDEWTENSTLWTSNADITESDDSIDGSYYGNKSIEFSVTNETQVWMQLSSQEYVNCLGIEGYKKMSFRTKVTCPTLTKPNNASLFLYSSPAEYFYHNLTEYLIPLNCTIWNNLTIPTGPETGTWVDSPTKADWSNITRLRLEFEWPENTNTTVRLDGLFFRGLFKSELENASGYVLNYSLFAFMQFTIKWVLLTGILYIMSKALGGKIVWRPLLVLVGFALITLFIQALINTLTYATASELYYPLEFFGGSKGEIETAYNKILEETWLVSLIGNYVQIAMYIWTISLCSVALRLLAEISWTKSFLIATVAYFVSLLIESVILGY